MEEKSAARFVSFATASTHHVHFSASTKKKCMQKCALFFFFYSPLLFPNQGGIPPIVENFLPQVWLWLEWFLVRPKWTQKFDHPFGKHEGQGKGYPLRIEWEHPVCNNADFGKISSMKAFEEGQVKVENDEFCLKFHCSSLKEVEEFSFLKLKPSQSPHFQLVNQKGRRVPRLESKIWIKSVSSSSDVSGTIFIRGTVGLLQLWGVP